MRGALDLTMDVFYGPNSPYGVPGVTYRTNVPCRVVPQTEISQRDFPLSLTSFWVTHDGDGLNVPDYKSTYLGEWNADIYTSDMVAFPSGGPPTHFAVRGEVVTPYGRPAYQRCLLVPISTVNPVDWLPPTPHPPYPYPSALCSLPTVLEDGVVNVFTLPAHVDPLWLRFEPVAPYDVYFSTVGVNVSSGYDIVMGDDCSLVYPVFGLDYDGYYTFNIAPYKYAWWQFHQPGAETPTIAIRASSAFI